MMLDHTDFRIRLNAIANGLVPVPNYEPQDPVKALGVIAGGLMVADPYGPNHILIPEAHAYRHTSGRFFLSFTQAGVFDGTGYVVWAAGDDGRIGRFALCKHNPIPGRDTNPSRGWYPARCQHCGLDMTVDSGG